MGRFFVEKQNLPLPAIAEAIASAGGPAPPLTKGGVWFKPSASTRSVSPLIHSKTQDRFREIYI